MKVRKSELQKSFIIDFIKLLLILKEVQEKFMNNTSSGGMAINETIFQISVESLPFGGVGSSGMGAYHGKVNNQ